MKITEPKVSSMLTTWKPTVSQMQKITELKAKLIIQGNTALVIKAIGELYEKELGKNFFNF